MLSPIGPKEIRDFLLGLGEVLGLLEEFVVGWRVTAIGLELSYVGTSRRGFAMALDSQLWG